jgi:hypothetical protein
MRKRLFKFASVLAVCLLAVGGSGAFEKKEQVGKVEIIPSSSFAVNAAELTEIDGRPHLKYSVTNVSKQTVPILTVTLTTFGGEGKLRARQIWRVRADLAMSSKMDSTLPVNAHFKPAARMVVEFASASALEGGGTCNDKFCNECTTNAINACGEGRVQGLSCTLSTCSCSFECKGEIQ